MVVPTGYLPKLGTFIPSCPSHRPHQFPLWSLMEACRHIWFWIQNPIYDLFPFVERAIHYQTTAQPTTHQKPDILLRPAYVHLPQKPSLIPLLVTLMVILHIQTVRAIALTGMAPGIVRDIQQKKTFFQVKYEYKQHVFHLRNRDGTINPSSLTTNLDNAAKSWCNQQGFDSQNLVL